MHQLTEAKEKCSMSKDAAELCRPTPASNPWRLDAASLTRFVSTAPLICSSGRLQSAFPTKTSRYSSKFAREGAKISLKHEASQMRPRWRATSLMSLASPQATLKSTALLEHSRRFARTSTRTHHPNCSPGRSARCPPGRSVSEVLLHALHPLLPDTGRPSLQAHAQGHEQ